MFSRRFESLLFVGGEPTLYIDKINRILSGVPVEPGMTVAITTNAHFAGTVAAAMDTLQKIRGLNFVQVSYDNYHKQFIGIDNIRNLYKASRNLGMKFSVIAAVQSPLDLVLLQELKAVGISGEHVRVQGVHAVGAAAANQLRYTYPSFNSTVLSAKCPYDGKIVYLCGEGFTACCSHLAFSPGNSDYIHPSIEQHFASKFYGLVSNFTFLELMKKSGLSVKDLAPEHSYPCALCALIFDSIKERRPALLR